MSRGYTHIKIQEERIIKLREAGKTRQEIANELGLTKTQLKNWVNRFNRRESQEGGNIAKVRGRKPAVTLQEYKYENKRLKMENELLRDFLLLAGRR